MKKTVFIILFTLVLTGCSSVSGLVSKIPSFWDDNQSSQIITVRQNIARITCAEGTQLESAQQVQRDLEWFRLYSESKGTRQQDVLRIVEPMEKTIGEWIKRSETQEGSKAYCELKKRTLKLQAARAAEAILGRF